ncbi:Homocysteine S-methyltransferase [Penicillium expansum]|nr:Homocysteine S-methyltransferase [Penicillium expansum]
MATIQILDGGLGTSLGDLYNIKFDSTTTPLWASHLLVSDPATLQACQRDFGVAGVDVLLTATYQVSAEGFARTKTPQFPDGIPRSAVGPFLQKAVDIAEQAKVRESASVALSLGPYGACMIPGQEYSGAYDAEHDSEESLYLWHLDRLRMFAEADGELVSRVRYVAFETLPRLDEVRAVRRAIRDSAFDVPFWIACVFPRDDDLLPDGSSVEEVVRAALAPLEEGVAKEEISAVPSLVLYPDGTNGEVYNTTTQIWEKNDALSDNVSDNSWEEQLAQVVNEAYEKGHFKSFLVGGCCKASHHDIKKLGQQFKTQ